MVERQPDWIAEAPIRTEARRTIAAPPDVVWAAIADHTGWPARFTALKTVTVTGEPTGIGGQRRVSVAGMRFDEVFTAWEPGRQFAFTVVATRPALFDSVAEPVTLSDAGNGSTNVTYAQGFAPRRGFGWVWKRARGRVEAGLGEALDGLAATVA